MHPFLLRRIARGLLALGLIGMGTAHFRPEPARTMAAMIPPVLRGRGLVSPESLVAVTGACELAGAAGLLVPRTRRLAGACLIAFFAAVFPANAYAAQHPERFGAVAFPFWPRLAGQVALAALALWTSRD
jgi:uncharacterized membrane protein